MTLTYAPCPIPYALFPMPYSPGPGQPKLPEKGYIYLPDRASMMPNCTAITPSIALPAQYKVAML